jgi:cation diffusion facilitator CzcD-associated flavoprotein CzcO
VTASRSPDDPQHVDVLIVGAGISGIAAAYHLRSKCPDKSFAILEARDSIGGTWDLFRYPGIRSDSDMYTLGFSFRPWREKEAIAGGESILRYIRDTAAEFGIDKKVVFNTRVERLSWSNESNQWTVFATDADGGGRVYTCDFFWSCAGYYRYEAGHTPEFPGTEDFRGRIVHPQKWTDDVDYEGKRVVVIGSGATAMTLVPAMADKAAHITMLQRSPTYVLSMPPEDRIAEWLKARLSAERAHSLIRWKNILFGILFYQYTRRFPGSARSLFIGQARKALGEDFDIESHFTPDYDPWDQRLCLIPNGDLFKSINDGKVTIVTDTIDTFTEKGILLDSGTELEADLIVTATGLHLQFLGGATIDIDGEAIEPKNTMMYKGMMLSGVPNAAFCMGYTNASWTLKAELTCEFVCELLNHMKRRDYDLCRPERDPSVREEPMMNLTAGYVRRALSYLPAQGVRRPWRVYQNYLLDMLTMRHSRIEDGTLRFSRRGADATSQGRVRPSAERRSG